MRNIFVAPAALLLAACGTGGYSYVGPASAPPPVQRGPDLSQQGEVYAVEVLYMDSDGMIRGRSDDNLRVGRTCREYGHVTSMCASAAIINAGEALVRGGRATPGRVARERERIERAKARGISRCRQSEKCRNTYLRLRDKYPF